MFTGGWNELNPHISIGTVTLPAITFSNDDRTFLYNDINIDPASSFLVTIGARVNEDAPLGTVFNQAYLNDLPGRLGGNVSVEDKCKLGIARLSIQPNNASLLCNEP